MNYIQWEPIYKKIINDFNFLIGEDIKSADILNNLLQKSNLIPIVKLKNLIINNAVVVFGAGPSLETSILRYNEEFSNKLIIAADGATSALLKNKIIPDIIVTDLDGDVSDQIKANFQGSIIIIHAHGDNIDKIRKYVSKFKGNIIGTTQTNPKAFENLYNFGGFTDGDRSVYLADHFSAKKITLIGFDFGNEIGNFSFSENKDINLKLKKLDWCKKLIDTLNTKKIRYQ